MGAAAGNRRANFRIGIGRRDIKMIDPAFQGCLDQTVRRILIENTDGIGTEGNN